jgi:hypothetical protein
MSFSRSAFRRALSVQAIFAAVIVSALLAAPFAAFAQLSGKGEIKGTVKDPSGAVVPNATVKMTDVATGQVVTRTSDGNGDFEITPLEVGKYTLTVAAPGFETLSQADVQVNALEIQNLNPVLTVGSANETVTVTSAAPQLETSNATLGATMEQEMYAALPIEMGAYGSPDQRRATDFAFLMPGVQGNNTNGNPTTNTGVINGSGSRGAVSDVYIEGVPFVRAGGNGDPRFVWTAISVDAVDQFQVQTSGYSAIYEGQGLQNYAIKSGGKNFHGAVYEFFRNTALDTWGFFGPENIVNGKKQKPIEHSNEYGINLSGPLVPFGGWRDKVFFFGNYNGFRFANESPTTITFPTAAEQGGDFRGSGAHIYDPFTQAACTAASTTGPCRYEYGMAYSGTPGPGGSPIASGQPLDVIPASEFSTVAKNMQSFLAGLPIGTTPTSNFLAPNRSGLTNWSTTDRIDIVLSQKDSISMVMALGRQASSNPVGQNTKGRNVGPVPYNFGQAYAPKTAVGVIEETHIFTPNLVNQIKYGYARYNGPTFDSDQVPQFSATAMGLSNLPAGAAQSAFPITSFSGTNAPTNWGGSAPNSTLAENYTALDNLQWVKGRHTITVGGQVAWLLYNTISATGGSTPLTLSNSVTETAGITQSTNAKPTYTALANTGLSYASFLIGQVDKASFTQYLQQEFGARFRAISPYVQDNWKVNSRLTLDLGLRYDFFPSVTEVHNAGSYFDPNLPNPVSHTNGALQFTGSGPNTCNCSTPVHNFHGNIGPRIGLAFQSDPKTVWRASYGIMFTHGNAVGGLATSLGTLGYSGGLSASSTQLQSTSPLTGANGTLPSFTAPTGSASGPGYGTGYTTTAGSTGSPQGMGYVDPYLGGRAPEYINYTFGFQHQWTNAITSTISYVGTQGHFEQTDGGNARGYFADQLDPKYLYLGTNLALTGAALTTFCGANSGICPSTLSTFNTSQTLAQLLKPFPFQNVSDAFGYVANSNYNGLQTTLNMRPSNGLSFMANYTWSRAIDDGGTFRTGYAIPAGTIANAPNASYAQDRIERNVSTTNQKHHAVVTGVWTLPFGKSMFATHEWQRAIFGGFQLSEIFQAYTGSPLPITATTCQTNPAQATCEPTLNPNFSGPARINGKWGQGVTAANYNQNIPGSFFIAPSACAASGGVATSLSGPFVASACANTNVAPSYTFGNSPRTAPYNIYGPGNYSLDLALVRSFPLHITEATKLNLRAEMYNVTNHTLFGVASTAVGNANFGQISPANSRRSVQLSARIEF